MGRGGTPAREISFVSLVAYGPKVSDSALAMGGYSFWNQAGRFPTMAGEGGGIWWSDTQEALHSVALPPRASFQTSLSFKILFSALHKSMG